MLILTSCCCLECEIFADDFSVDNLASDYTQDVGSWSVGGGVLTTTSASARLLINATSSTGNGSATVDGKVSLSGAGYRLLGAWTDANNHLYADVIVNGASSTYKVFKVESGAPTQLGTTFTFTGSTNQFLELKLCWNGAYVTSWVNGPGIFRLVFESCTMTGDQAGLEASANGGTVTFNDLYFGHHPTDDPDCPCFTGCAECIGSVSPAQTQLDVTGIVNGTGGANCTNYNATYVLPNSGTFCAFAKNISNSAGVTCSGQAEFASWTFQFTSTTNRVDFVGAFGASGSSLHFTTTSQTSPRNCLVQDTLTGDSGTAGQCCNFSSFVGVMTPLY
jgi:hypothetical protein